MSNLIQMERHRLRLYGEMLKSDLTERRNQEKLQKQANLKRDSLDMERHIENTRKMDLSRKIQQKSLNNALKEDNMMLSTLKKSMTLEKTYAESGQNFINSIHQMDIRRLGRLKNDLVQQFHDNKDYTTSKKVIEDKLRQIEKEQAQRHANRVKEMQLQSLKSYEEIKRKYQQDMNLFQKHKRLVEENQNFREQVESFTNVKTGIFDRFNRNQYLQRRNSLRENQDQILKQMQQFQRRKHQDNAEYKRKVGDLEDSMLASILSKPPRYEPRAYSHELRNQMQENSLKKYQENNAKKEKVELNNIYGGVHGNQRQKMIKIVDKGLGIDRYSQQISNKTVSSKSELQNESQFMLENNPELKLSESQRYPTPKTTRKRSQQDYTQQHASSNIENQVIQSQNQAIRNDNASDVSVTSSQKRRYFKSYDLIAGKNKFYGQ